MRVSKISASRLWLPASSLILQASNALVPRKPGTLLTMTFNKSSTLAILTLNVGSAGLSAACRGDILRSSVGSNFTPRGGGVPDRVYGTQSSGTRLAKQCWHGVSLLHRCFRFAHSAHARATRRFFFFDPSSVSLVCFADVCGRGACDVGSEGG